MKKNEDNDINETSKFQILLEERARLFESGSKSIEQFDKGILTISAGALALSITFIKSLIPTPKPESIIFLILTWLFFAISMLTTLISFLLSHKAFNIAIENLQEDDPKTNKFSIATGILNYLSASVLTGGFVFWGIFMVKNLIK